MIKAILRLILIGILSLILLVLAVFVMRQAGYREGFADAPLSWFQQKFWWVYQAPTSFLCQKETLEPAGGPWIFVLPLDDQDGKWVVPCPQKAIPVDDYLKEHAHKNWLLSIQLHETVDLDRLVATLDPFSKTKHFGLVSLAQKVGMYLRKQEPEWAFGADSVSMLRLHVFESIWIETATDFWPDFVIASRKPDDMFYVDARAARELKRRKKRIIWNWSPAEEKWPKLYEIDGVMTSDPAAAVARFSLPAQK